MHIVRFSMHTEHYGYRPYVICVGEERRSGQAQLRPLPFDPGYEPFKILLVGRAAEVGCGLRLLQLRYVRGQFFCHQDLSSSGP